MRAGEGFWNGPAFSQIGQQSQDAGAVVTSFFVVDQAFWLLTVAPEVVLGYELNRMKMSSDEAHLHFELCISEMKALKPAGSAAVSIQLWKI